MNLASTLRSPRVLAALLALLGGCFTEPQESPMTTGTTCDPGSFGCECLDGVCQPDLECTPSNVCIPEDCTPGTAVCECDDQGRCGPGLECSDNVCLPTGGTSVGTSETETVGPTSTTGTNTTGTTNPDDTSTTESVDDSTTVGDEMTTTGPSDTTDMPMMCSDQMGPKEQACLDCFDCTHGNECEELRQACTEAPGCVTIATCMQSCAVQGFCFEDCCEGEAAASVTAALALQTCREDVCIEGACTSYAAFLCGG